MTANLKSMAITCAVTGVLLVLCTGASAMCRGMDVYASRGAPTAPENSVAGVQLAFDGDWDGAEIDVWQLRDRTWVLHSDDKLGRVTSVAKRNVRDFDITAWKDIRVKDRSGRLTADHPAILNDVLAAVKERDGKVLSVDVRQSNAFSCEPAQHVVSLLKAGHPQGQWFLSSADRRQLACARKADPSGFMNLVIQEPQNRRSNVATMDVVYLKKLQKEVGMPVGVQVDITTMAANPELLSDALALAKPVFTYHSGGDRDLAQALRYQARRTGLLPSGVVINGSASAFCALLGNLAP